MEFSQTVFQRASGDMDEFPWDVYSVRSIINPFLGLSVSLAHINLSFSFVHAAGKCTLHQLQNQRTRSQNDFNLNPTNACNV